MPRYVMLGQVRICSSRLVQLMPESPGYIKLVQVKRG